MKTYGYAIRHALGINKTKNQLRQYRLTIGKPTKMPETNTTEELRIQYNYITKSSCITILVTSKASGEP